MINSVKHILTYIIFCTHIIRVLPSEIKYVSYVHAKIYANFPNPCFFGHLPENKMIYISLCVCCSSEKHHYIAFHAMASSTVGRINGLSSVHCVLLPHSGLPDTWRMLINGRKKKQSSCCRSLQLIAAERLEIQSQGNHVQLKVALLTWLIWVITFVVYIKQQLLRFDNSCTASHFLALASVRCHLQLMKMPVRW